MQKFEQLCCGPVLGVYLWLELKFEEQGKVLIDMEQIASKSQTIKQ